MAGVDPQVGLFGSICILIVVALLMGGLVQSHGLTYLLAASILAGVFQILWGYLRLAQQMRFVPRAVTVGFVNAIGVLIFLAQLPQLGIGAMAANPSPVWRPQARASVGPGCGAWWPWGC